MWSELVNREFFGSFVSTIVLIVAVLVGRRFAVSAILRRESLPHELQRRWIINARNIAIAIGLFGVVIIWGTELRAFALSIAAFGVAIIIATKELILCFSGGIYRAGLRSFAIGARVEIAGIRGDVIDKSLMSTTILEIGPGGSGQQYTGRAVVVPNSLLLTTTVFDESYMERFAFHLFPVKVAKDLDWTLAEEWLLEAARDECGPYLTQAREHLEALRRAHGLPTITAEPQVSVRIADDGSVDLLVRVPVPLRQRGQVEQGILRGYLARVAASKE